MKALQLIAAGAPLETVELPDPTAGEGEAVVRVAAAGICRSDVHYRMGEPKLPPLPRVLGHEVAGVVVELGDGSVEAVRVGDRVGVHYLVSCGDCDMCARGREQFCPTGAMIGNQRDGGYAEYITMPVQNLVPVPAGIPLSHAAVTMCSSATVYHALKRARLAPGERVVVLGLGGLGSSAIQIAQALGASVVYGVDTDATKVALAGSLGAVGIDASVEDVSEVLAETGGVDVAVELAGLPVTTRQAVASLAPFGRAVIVGLATAPTSIHGYHDLIMKEAEVLGVADHLRHELPAVLDLVASGALRLDDIVTGTVPLEATAVNAALDRLEVHGGGVRTVIVPHEDP